ncbi:MAG: hypothetical protein QOF83_3344 [Solirubrobacteraceae bacterium]|jgi:hypothetical protein|nr:hypothetical protein [Solirubrobacteraceae bacterium]
MRRTVALLLAVGAALTLTGVAGARVLRVGTFHGVRGQYRTIPAAVKAARPGDWILLAPGDYKTRPRSITTPKGHKNFPAAVLITKARVHIRGMNRNSVMIDGTKPGFGRCSRSGKAQNFGLKVKGNKPSGVNGIEVYKAGDVAIENLTVCNFLGGSQNAGNGIWWNGGDGSGKVQGHGFFGGYLSATSTYLKNKSAAGEFTAAQYGIFSSNWNGGTWNQIYASNFNDSGFYIGACQQVCNQTLNHGHAQYNALGYSGTNSGGRMLIENSEFDSNEDGFSTNSQNADEPAPQNGACPAGVTPPVKGAHSCWVFFHNYVHNNNNPNVPAAGSAAAGPVGTGMSAAGSRNDTIMNNTFANNNAWGIIFVPYLDSGKPCDGGTFGGTFGPTSCVWDDYGNALVGNLFTNNGNYGHPSNGDLGQVNLETHPTNCYSGNHESGGAPIRPAGAAALQAEHPACNGTPQPAGTSSDPNFLSQVLCDTQIELSPGVSSCPPGTTYPRVSHIVMHPLRKQRTMPNPCAGVPRNPWCGKRA